MTIALRPNHNVVLILLVCLDAVTTQGRAQVEFSTGTHQAKFVKTMKAAGGVVITRFVMEGSSEDEWTEALEVLEIPHESFPPTAPKAFEQLKASRSQACRSTQYEVLEQSKKSMLWVGRAADCQTSPNQHAINRLIYEDSQLIYLLIFTVAGEMDAAKRDEWIKLLAEAKPAPRTVRTILFTTAPSNLTTEYLAVVFDTLVRVRFDTILAIGEAGHVVGIDVHEKECLRFDRARLGRDSVLALASSDRHGQLLGKVYINVARDSWTWDGAAPSASLSPAC